MFEDHKLNILNITQLLHCVNHPPEWTRLDTQLFARIINSSELSRERLLNKHKALVFIIPIRYINCCSTTPGHWQLNCKSFCCPQWQHSTLLLDHLLMLSNFTQVFSWCYFMKNLHPDVESTSHRKLIWVQTYILSLQTRHSSLGQFVKLVKHQKRQWLSILSQYHYFLPVSYSWRKIFLSNICSWIHARKQAKIRVTDKRL